MKKIFTKENMKKFFDTYVWLMVLLFVIDIVTKWVVVKHFGVDNMNAGVTSEKGAIEVIKNFAYIGGAINDGAAYSILRNRPILLTISIVMTAGFIIYYVHEYKKLRPVYKISLALMIAGGFGNLIDRAFYWPGTTGFNGVIDWIIFEIGGFPIFGTFNIADSCLVIGIIIIIVQMVIEEVKETIEKGKKGEYKYSPEELEKKNNEANKDK